MNKPPDNSGGKEFGEQDKLLSPADMKFVFIPGGQFQMGCLLGAEPEETPVHQVNIQPFYMAQYPVTQSQWVKIMGGQNPAMVEGEKQLFGLTKPVVNVSWDDVQKFISRINRFYDQKYRLPSEAEWEYAARACGEHQLYAGTDQQKSLFSYAWYAENSRGCLQDVGLKSSNKLGLYDMSGNVLEWCADTWQENYHNAPTDGSPWICEEHMQKRVCRGGSCECDASLCRVSSRDYEGMSCYYAGLGFRLAKDIE